MKKKLIYALIIISLILSFVLNSRHVAIEHTIQECNTFHLRQVEPIQEITASFYLLHFLENIQESTLPNRYPSYLPVWVVTMKGTWEIFGGPPPE